MTAETQNTAVAERGERTELIGKVTSAKMEKTIVVEVIRLVQQAKQGDTVRISATRPLSKLKRWRLKDVLTRNASAQ